MESTTPRSPYDRTLFPDGEDPDPRFTLANERTFLAWIRTSLALLAGGIALEAIELPGLGAETRSIAAIVFVIVSVLMAIGGAVRWVRVERALRHNRSLPAPALAPVLVIACIIGALIVLLGIA